MRKGSTPWSRTQSGMAYSCRGEIVHFAPGDIAVSGEDVSRNLAGLSASSRNDPHGFATARYFRNSGWGPAANRDVALKRGDPFRSASVGSSNGTGSGGKYLYIELQRYNL
jgi:hypothetical protein